MTFLNGFRTMTAGGSTLGGKMARFGRIGRRLAVMGAVVGLGGGVASVGLLALEASPAAAVPCSGLLIRNVGGTPATGTANSTYTGSFTVSVTNCTGGALTSMKLQGGTAGWLSGVSSITHNPATGTVLIKNNPAHVVTWKGFNLANLATASITVHVTGTVPKGACGSTLPISGNWTATGHNASNNSVNSGPSTAATISVTC
jgi:hypothetical protein